MLLDERDQVSCVRDEQNWPKHLIVIVEHHESAEQWSIQIHRDVYVLGSTSQIGLEPLEGSTANAEACL